MKMGLINYAVNRDKLDEEVNIKLKYILNNGPNAVKTVRK